MGYYVAVPCVSTKARGEMLAFMAEHFRTAQTLMGWVTDEYGVMPGPAKGKSVCAYAKANEIGWYRNAGWDEEACDYASCLLRWMALKIGRTMQTEDEEIPGYGPMGVHFTIYEGDPQPFVLHSQCPNAPDGWDADYDVCDDLGWDRSMRGPPPGEDPQWDAENLSGIMDIRRRKAKADPIIRAELERLEALWNAR
jgi:hypothetical protein